MKLARAGTRLEARSTDAPKRLRVAGIVSVAVIALLALIQGSVVQWHYASAPKLADAIDASGARGFATMNVLFRAERVAASPGERPALRAAIDDVRRRHAALADLSKTQQATYLEFVADAEAVVRNPDDEALQARLGALGFRLIETYGQKTARYALADETQRRRLRDRELVQVALLLIVLAFLYVSVMRPGERNVRRALEELEARRERFAAMFDHSSEMIALYDAEGRIVRANPAAIAALGMGDEAIGKNFMVHVPQSERPKVERAFAEALAGHPSQYETRFTDRTGSDVKVVASVAPVIVRGNVVGIVGSARDMSALDRAEKELTRSRERFRSLFSQSPNAVLSILSDGSIGEVNPQLERLSGYHSAEIAGKPWSVLTPPNRQDSAHGRLAQMLSGSLVAHQSVMRCKDGSDINVQIEASPIGVGDQIEGIFVTMRDLTADQALTRCLEATTERVHGLYLAASSSSDARGQIDDVLAYGLRTLGMEYGFVTHSEGNGTVKIVHRHGANDRLPIGAIVPETSIESRLSRSPRAAALEDLTVEPYAEEMFARRVPWKSYIGSRIAVDKVPYGSLVFFGETVRGTPFEGSDFDFMELMAWLIGNAVGRGRRESDLEKSAHHDALTGLANRRLLEDHAKLALSYARRTNTRVALHYVDLDRFKPVNDVHGHTAGDELLREVARRLGDILRKQDLLARIGGDEFVVLQTAITDESAVSSLAERLAETFDLPITVARGVSVAVGGSLGAAVYPSDARDFEGLLEAADAAMYANKQQRRLTAQSA